MITKNQINRIKKLTNDVVQASIAHSRKVGAAPEDRKALTTELEESKRLFNQYLRNLAKN